jgi:hypothetical protein
MADGKIFVIAILALRGEQYAHNAWLAEHASRAEAEQAGRMHALKVCPVAEGWTHHNVSVQEWNVSVRYDPSAMEIILRCADALPDTIPEIVIEGPDAIM